MGSPCLSRLAIQEIEGLFVANPVADSIQRSITCQTSADGVCGLICLSRQRFNLAINFFVADFNFFFVGNLFEQQGSLDFLQSLLALPGAKPRQVHFLHVLGTHPLGCERAKATFKADIYLMLDESFWNLELVATDKFGKQFVFGVALGVLAAFVFHAFADALPDVVKGGEFAKFLREFVIQLGKSLLLDCVHLDLVAEGLAAQAFVRKIFGIDNVKRTFLTSICAA